MAHARGKQQADTLRRRSLGLQGRGEEAGGGGGIWGHTAPAEDPEDVAPVGDGEGEAPVGDPGEGAQDVGEGVEGAEMEAEGEGEVGEGEGDEVGEVEETDLMIWTGLEGGAD